MENEIKVGEYIRTELGYTGKVQSVNMFNADLYRTNNGTYSKEEIVKHSFDIVDLIEEGDYVNGKKVICLRNSDCSYDIGTQYNDDYGSYFGINKDDIKSIVTREQLESIEYEV